METLTVDQLQENFDEYMNRVESGESFVIISERGNVMMIPYGEYNELDDLVRIHTDHEEGC
jgi:prevent-host-death family protein